MKVLQISDLHIGKIGSPFGPKIDEDENLEDLCNIIIKKWSGEPEYLDPDDPVKWPINELKVENEGGDYIVRDLYENEKVEIYKKKAKDLYDVITLRMIPKLTLFNLLLSYKKQEKIIQYEFNILQSILEMNNINETVYHDDSKAFFQQLFKKVRNLHEDIIKLEIRYQNVKDRETFNFFMEMRERINQYYI